MIDSIKALECCDLLYLAGYEARQKEQDYDPRGCEEWQHCIDVISGHRASKPNTKAIHLGDGAYASIDANGNLIITANHHEQDQATDVVAIESQAVSTLAAFIKKHYQEEL